MTPLSHSQRLRQKIELVLPEFSDASTELVTHLRFRELYPQMLVRMYWMIRASVPLMQASLRRCQELAADDELARAMIPYLTQHIKEEMYHDDWLLEDLELLGVPRSEVLRQIPSPSAAKCIGTRYYWVLHHHPVAELGGLAVMEGYPPSQAAIDWMEEATGYPRAAFRTIEKHGLIDPHHRDELMSAIDALPLTEEHHAMLGVSALTTVELASAVYREVTALLPVDEEAAG